MIKCQNCIVYLPKVLKGMKPQLPVLFNTEYSQRYLMIRAIRIFRAPYHRTLCTKCHSNKQLRAVQFSVFCYGRTNHKAPQCRFKDSVCSYCNKKGHLARACRSKQSGLKDKLSTHLVAEELEEHDDEYSLYYGRNQL